MKTEHYTSPMKFEPRESLVTVKAYFKDGERKEWKVKAVTFWGVGKIIEFVDGDERIEIKLKELYSIVIEVEAM